jgi:transglutaminase-like putative cysteine protease
VVLQRSEYLYAGKGEIQVHCFRVVKVLTEAGTREAVFAHWGLGGRASTVKEVKGWNCPPEDGGAPTFVNESKAVLVDPDAPDEITSALETVVRLAGVVPGSLVAFESREILTPPLGPFATIRTVERNPVLHWELEADSRWWVSASIRPVVESWHLEPWSRDVVSVPGRSLRISRMPAWDVTEGGTPPPSCILPFVAVSFNDPACPVAGDHAWSGIGQWTARQFSTRAEGPLDLPAFEGGTREKLAALHGWIRHNLLYRSVRLSADRGWMPEPPAVTLRRRTGDCKDMACFMVGAARRMGLQAFPALTCIVTGRLEGDEPPSPSAFNHAIAAIALPAPMGLPAEVDVDGTAYLLADPTDRISAFGTLGGQHAGGHVLLCLPSGGRWVAVPDRALDPRSLDVSWQARAEDKGTLKGMLVVREHGDALGLASRYLLQGRTGLEHQLFPFLSRDPSCSLEIRACGDPLEGTFEVQVGVETRSDGSRAGPMGRALFMGLPGAPVAIQRVGRPRQLPVEAGADLEMTWKARLHVPPGWAPARNQDRLSTPFRDVQWTAGLGAEGETAMDLKMTLHRRRWEPSARQEGLAAYDADRDAYAAFMGACTALVKGSSDRAH